MSSYVPSGYAVKALICAVAALSMYTSEASAAQAAGSPPATSQAPAVIMKTQSPQPNDIYFQAPKGSNNRLNN
jgi:hypothetical protein